MKNALLQFAVAKGIGDVSLKKAIAFIENSGCSWEDLCSSPQLLQSELNLKEDIVRNIKSAKTKSQEIFDALSEKGISILVENEDSYPQYLKKMLLDKSPPLLFVKGSVSLLNQPAVGFCGSRKVSSKGLTITSNCAKQLVERDIVVISGYAAGTDLSAHRSALENGGNTVFVLAEGILKTSIKGEVKELINSTNHAFVSQFPPLMTWNAGNAMKRNSVIIGLSRSMILIESGKTGGTFAAGEEALRVKCPLFVINFAQPEVSAEANPYFIAKGGVPIGGKTDGTPSLKKVFAAVENDIRFSSLESDMSNLTEQIRLDM